MNSCVDPCYFCLIMKDFKYLYILTLKLPPRCFVVWFPLEVLLLMFPSKLSIMDTVLCFRLPGDARTRVGFLTFDTTIHFYNLQEGLSQPQMLVVSDIDGTSLHCHKERLGLKDWPFAFQLLLLIAILSKSR